MLLLDSTPGIDFKPTHPGFTCSGPLGITELCQMAISFGACKINPTNRMRALHTGTSGMDVLSSG